jgi:hypothetical protein
MNKSYVYKKVNESGVILYINNILLIGSEILLL